MPKKLALLAAGPPPKVLAFCTDPGFGASAGLLGVENNPKPAGLLVPPPNKFPPLEPPSPKSGAGLLVFVLPPKSDVAGAVVAGVPPKLLSDGAAEDTLLCPKMLLLCPPLLAVPEPYGLPVELLLVRVVPNRPPVPPPLLVGMLPNENGPDDLGGPDMVKESFVEKEC